MRYSKGLALTPHPARLLAYPVNSSQARSRYAYVRVGKEKNRKTEVENTIRLLKLQHDLSETPVLCLATSVPSQLAYALSAPFPYLLWFSPYRRCDLKCQGWLLEPIPCRCRIWN